MATTQLNLLQPTEPSWEPNEPEPPSDLARVVANDASDLERDQPEEENLAVEGSDR